MGLGTGRRVMKSPPLLIAVLLACVFVLGINYWITSSRCVELQNRVMELEGRMRRAAAERGAVEMKKNEYEDMLSKQKKQIDTIQSLHSGQMHNVRLLCDSEKEQLLNNITAKDNMVQTLQVQISNAHKRLESFKQEFKDLEDTQAKKLSYELAQCGNKIAEAKEQCEERLRTAVAGNILNDGTEKNIIKLEDVKSTEKIHVAAKDLEEKEEMKPNITPALSLDDKVDAKMGVSPVNKELAVVDKQPSAAPQKPEQKPLEKEKGDLQEPVNEVRPNSFNPAEEDEEVKTEDIVEKDGNKDNEEVDRENLINLEGLQEEDKGEKPNAQDDDAENQNIYNGDDGKEPEPEAEKQAELIDNDQNLREDKIQNNLNDQALDQEAEDDEPAVK
ncbi:Golgi membrane protein 1 [Gastrophryne carolinensis]